MAEGGRGRRGGGGERLLQREREEVGEGEKKKGEIGFVEEMTVSLCFHVLTTLARAVLDACPEVCTYLMHEVTRKKKVKNMQVVLCMLGVGKTPPGCRDDPCHLCSGIKSQLEEAGL